jgi:2-phosphosulfolactate phosphatase
LPLTVNLEFAAKDAVKAVRRGDIIIVIDVLRCSSTIVTALANGAKGIIPVETIKEAWTHHRKHPEFLLAGERKGLKPKEFDLGNSPLDFSPETVKEKNIILTTTSGTKAISSAKKGRKVLVGAFLNVEAVAEAALKIAEKSQAGISIVLSGRIGHFSLEDFLCAGAIVQSLLTKKVELSDAALASLLAFQKALESLSTIVQRGSHARYLESIGLKEDVLFCSRMNVFQVVPVLEGETIIPLDVSRF